MADVLHGLSGACVSSVSVAAKEVTVDRARGGAANLTVALLSLASRRWMDPADFGDEAELQKDAAPAFDRMLASVPDGAPLSIRLQPRVYRLSRTLNLKGRNLAILGAGSGLTVLEAMHNAGEVIKYTGEGDSVFAAMTLRRGLTNSDSALDVFDGLLSDPGQGRTTLRLSLIDVFVERNAGNGIKLVNPELAYVAVCGASRNGVNGLLLVGRDLENIENTVERTRLRDNKLHGLVVQNLSFNKIDQVECLNNLGSSQMHISGTNNRVVQADLEAFAVPAVKGDDWGLTVSGRGNLILSINVFKCSNGIKLISAPKTKISGGALKGSAGKPMNVGVEADSFSDDSTAETISMSYVNIRVRGVGSADG